MAVKIAPTMIKGRRRPQRDRKLSLIDPINGSVKASHNRGRASASPIRAGFTPSVRLKTGNANWTTELSARFSPNAETPNETQVPLVSRELLGSAAGEAAGVGGEAFTPRERVSSRLPRVRIGGSVRFQGWFGETIVDLLCRREPPSRPGLFRCSISELRNAAMTSGDS